MIERLITDLGHSLGHWAYLLVSFMAMAETAAFAGFVAPGEFAVIFGGVLAGEGTLNVVLLVGVVWVSCVIGDSIGFYLGHRLGRAWAVKHGAKVRLTEDRLAKVESFFGRHGGKAIVIGRWVGFVRPLMPFSAGTSGMPYRRFLPYDVIGAGLWGTTFTLLGYIFWRSFSKITNIASRGALVFGLLVVLALGTHQAVKRLRTPEDRARAAAWFEHQAQRPALRPVAAVVRPLWRYVLHPLWRLISPPLRFLIGRLRPGGLGIEFTTVAAIFAVSLYTVILQIGLIEDGKSITGDSWGLDLARDVQTSAMTTLAEVVSFFGRLYVVTTAVCATALALAIKRRVWEAATLVAGLVVTEVSVEIIKEAVERPRPGDGLVGANGFGYPSGHAALAVSYLAISVALSRLVSLPYRLALVLTGLGMAIAIGVSRVYLRVHHLSDVGGGWAVGLAAYSGCAIVAMLAVYLRHSFSDREHSPARAGDVASRRAGG
jgi:membrane protein DedA with SNARE-associated domain